MELIDITVPIRSGMFVYEGDPEVHVERVSSIAAGDAANLSRLDFGVHSGTHIDAPLHFIEDAAGVDATPLETLIGPAHVVDGTALDADIDADAIATLDIPDDVERLLFKTPNSELWNRDTFSKDFIRFVEGGARRIAERGVRLVGIDYLSIGDRAAHRVLLEAGVIPLEGLDLRSVEPGPYRLVCLPVKIEGCDGAPARALLSRPALEGEDR